MITTDDMQKLVQEAGVLDQLTDKLKLKVSSGSKRFPAWHPGYFRNELEQELPLQYAKMLDQKNDIFDSSFVTELQKVDGIVWVYPREYPSLFDPEASESLAVLTIPFIEWFMHHNQLNANALTDLRDILNLRGYQPWFSVPPVPVADDIVKRNAVREALLRVSRHKPKVFMALVDEAIYVSGFDANKLSKNELADFISQVLKPE